MADSFPKLKIKSSIKVRSLDAYPEEIQNFMVRHYKYFSILNQFNEVYDMDKIAVLRFFRKIRTVKIVKTLTLRTDLSLSNVQVSSGSVKSLLKAHGQSLKSFNVCDLQCFQADFPTNFLQPVKNLKTIHLKTRKAEIRGLCISKALDHILLDLRGSKVNISRLYSPIARLRNLKRFELLTYPADLNKLVEFLKQITTKYSKDLDIRMTTLKGDENYSIIPDIDGSLPNVVTQLNFECISAIPSISSLLSRFLNLKKLGLEFSVSDLSLMDYLKILPHMYFLERLFLKFAESSPKEFSTALMNNLQLPVSLQEFEIEMPLSLEEYILNNLNLIKDSKRRYSWRERNYFEEETALKSFFESFKNARNLRRLVFDCKMLESFSSYFTNFFISILTRTPSLYSFVLCTRDKTVQKTIKGPPECFDLSLLFNCCSHMPNLEGLEVVMPNLLFDDAELSFDLTKLKEFHIGITDQEEDSVLSFSDNSKQIEKLVKTLADKAPNLKSLILDFREIISESKLCKRFLLIEKLKNLEYLVLRIVAPKFNAQAVQTVGGRLQALRKLRTLVLHFDSSDPMTFSLTTYIGYHKSIREVQLISNGNIWLGKQSLDGIDLNAFG